MGKLSTFLILVLSAAVTLPAMAGPNDCDKGDTQMGPNCVNTEWVDVGGMKYPASTVYRVKGGEKTIVWHDQGEVHTSKASHLIVHQLIEDDDGERNYEFVRYNWSDKLGCYARPGGCYLK